MRPVCALAVSTSQVADAVIAELARK